jgi:DEAD/DEAH box helicase domain-containing protein
MVHEQAIYQHDGECWQVEKFDYENHKAFVRKVKPDYWTDAMTYTQVNVLEEFGTGSLSEEPWPTGWGEVSVVEKVVGYKKIKFYTHENAGYGDVRLPEMQMHTTAFWLTVPEPVIESMPEGRAAAIDGLRGVGIALETVSTLALMCDPRDLGCTLGNTDPDAQTPPGKAHPRVKYQEGYSPTLFLYEHTPGGIGLSERIFAQRDVLCARALALIEGCPCVSGCPACVGPAMANEMIRSAEAPAASNRRAAAGRKAVAIDLLRRALPRVRAIAAR